MFICFFWNKLLICSNIPCRCCYQLSHSLSPKARSNREQLHQTIDSPKSHGLWQWLVLTDLGSCGTWVPSDSMAIAQHPNTVLSTKQTFIPQWKEDIYSLSTGYLPRYVIQQLTNILLLKGSQPCKLQLIGSAEESHWSLFGCG